MAYGRNRGYYQKKERRDRMKLYHGSLDTEQSLKLLSFIEAKEVEL
jgi:hypothetical protein